MALQPADACPFARPFDDGFSACPAYQRQEFVALDTQYRFLRVLNSCRHLSVRSLPPPAAGFYAACGLGDRAAREHWVQQVEQRRLEGIRGLGRDIAAATSGLTQELWAAKGDQLRALRAGRSTARATNRLRRIVADYERQATVFFTSRRSDLEALGLAEQVCVEVIREALEEFVEARTLDTTAQPSDRVMERFSPAVRTLLRPNSMPKPG